MMLTALVWKECILGNVWMLCKTWLLLYNLKSVFWQKRAHFQEKTQWKGVHFENGEQCIYMGGGSLLLQVLVDSWLPPTSLVDIGTANWKDPCLLLTRCRFALFCEVYLWVRGILGYCLPLLVQYDSYFRLGHYVIVWCLHVYALLLSTHRQYRLPHILFLDGCKKKLWLLSLRNTSQMHLSVWKPQSPLLPVGWWGGGHTNGFYSNQNVWTPRVYWQIFQGRYFIHHSGLKVVVILKCLGGA